MLRVQNQVVKKQPRFWNGAVFHPTDAVEDPWGRRILDTAIDEGALNTVRVYTMFEDIVYTSENGELMYDFRLSDLRLDYLTEKGYGLLLAYAGIPDCIASSTAYKISAAKNKTRYKGKMWNTSSPRDNALWEEICYEYTKHNVERYGIETVSKWRCHCFNEPDIPNFFLSELPSSALNERLQAYCELYEAFQRGVRRVSEEILVGGPALASHGSFLSGFLDYVRETGLKLDFISVHHYGTSVRRLNEGIRPYNAKSIVHRYEKIADRIKEHGFGNLPVVIDEWGMSSSGFYNKEECPALMAREHEVFSAYYAKLLSGLIGTGLPIDGLMICLSGQHEMVEDFSGFRNFFTLNFIRKPIYNAHVLASRLGEQLLSADCDNENVFTVPTKRENGDYALLVSYSSENFKEDIPSVEETVTFDEDISGKTVTVWCIDKETTNPYRMWERAGSPEMTEDMLKALREEGRLKPVKTQDGSEPLTLRLTPNATYLITVEK